MSLANFRCGGCTSLVDFKSFSTNKAFGAAGAGAVTAAVGQLKANGSAPSIEQLGRSGWTILHSIAAKYPSEPTNSQQKDLKDFVGLWSRLYPCGHCASDFEDYIEENKVQTKNQDDFGKWLCNAHNAVNVKIGKPKFDCNLWKQRWKHGESSE